MSRSRPRPSATRTNAATVLHRHFECGQCQHPFLLGFHSHHDWPLTLLSVFCPHCRYPALVSLPREAWDVQVSP